MATDEPEKPDSSLVIGRIVKVCKAGVIDRASLRTGVSNERIEERLSLPRSEGRSFSELVIADNDPDGGELLTEFDDRPPEEAVSE